MHKPGASYFRATSAGSTPRTGTEASRFRFTWALADCNGRRHSLEGRREVRVWEREGAAVTRAWWALRSFFVARNADEDHEKDCDDSDSGHWFSFADNTVRTASWICVLHKVERGAYGVLTGRVDVDFVDGVDLVDRPPSPLRPPSPQSPRHVYHDRRGNSRRARRS